MRTDDDDDSTAVAPTSSWVDGEEQPGTRAAAPEGLEAARAITDAEWAKLREQQEALFRTFPGYERGIDLEEILGTVPDDGYIEDGDDGAGIPPVFTANLSLPKEQHHRHDQLRDRLPRGGFERFTWGRHWPEIREWMASVGLRIVACTADFAGWEREEIRTFPSGTGLGLSVTLRVEVPESDDPDVWLAVTMQHLDLGLRLAAEALSFPPPPTMPRTPAEALLEASLPPVAERRLKLRNTVVRPATPASVWKLLRWLPVDGVEGLQQRLDDLDDEPRERWIRGCRRQIDRFLDAGGTCSWTDSEEIHAAALLWRGREAFDAAVADPDAHTDDWPEDSDPEALLMIIDA